MVYAIKTVGLEFQYPDGYKALHGIDMCVEKGEKVAILGPNGSGKSTLLYHFNGLLKPSGGSVYIFDKKIDKKNIDSVRQQVGVVFQDPDSQLFAPTVRHDISFGPANLGLPYGEIEKKVNKVMDQFGITELADRNPDTLSEGQKKRAAIAGVIAMDPDILVMDEPTSGLDPKGAEDTIDIIEELNAEGKTIVISTHDVDLAAGWSDRVYVIEGGRVYKSGRPCDVLSDNRLIKKTSLRQPAVVRTFRELEARGILSGEAPMSVLDFVDSLTDDSLKVRCAVADKDVKAGDNVVLFMKNGMLYAAPIRDDYKKMDERFHTSASQAEGKVIGDAAEGEDILVSDVAGNVISETGSITVVRIPKIIEGGSRAVDMESLRSLIKSQKIGAMGTSAKIAVKKAGISCDFDVDVIQSGILAALRGLDVIIFATGAMSERVAAKIEESNRKRKEIRYSITQI